MLAEPSQEDATRTRGVTQNRNEKKKREREIETFRLVEHGNQQPQPISEDETFSSFGTTTRFVE